MAAQRAPRLLQFSSFPLFKRFFRSSLCVIKLFHNHSFRSFPSASAAKKSFPAAPLPTVDLNNSLYKLAIEKKDWKQLEASYFKLIKSSSEKPDAKDNNAAQKPSPDIHTYNSLLIACANEQNARKRNSQIDFILAEMQKYNITVHVSTLTILVNIATMYGHFATAKHLILAATNQLPTEEKATISTGNLPKPSQTLKDKHNASATAPAAKTQTDSSNNSEFSVAPNEFTLYALNHPTEFLFGNTEKLKEIAEKTQPEMPHSPQYYTEKCLHLLDQYIANPSKVYQSHRTEKPTKSQKGTEINPKEAAKESAQPTATETPTAAATALEPLAASEAAKKSPKFAKTRKPRANETASVQQEKLPPTRNYPLQILYKGNDLLALLADNSLDSLTVSDLKAIQTAPELMKQQKADSSRKKEGHVEKVKKWLETQIPPSAAGPSS
jgi:hypothetical protein